MKAPYPAAQPGRIKLVRMLTSKFIQSIGSMDVKTARREAKTLRALLTETTKALDEELKRVPPPAA